MTVLAKTMTAFAASANRTGTVQEQAMPMIQSAARLKNQKLFFFT